MSSSSVQAKGLTKVIYEALERMTLEIAAEGVIWSNDLLDEVGRELRGQMAEPATKRERLIFDMVFQRSFAEARRLLLSSLPPQFVYDQGDEAAFNLA